MQVVIETLGALKRRMTVVIPNSQIENEVNKRIDHLAKTAKRSGFRQGKVPKELLKQSEGTYVREDVQRDVMQSSFYEAAQKEKVNPAGLPSFEVKEMAGDNFEFSAEFEVFPEIKFHDLTGAKIEKSIVNITDADVEKVLDSLQHQVADWEVVDRPAANGDQVIIDFVGSVDGIEFPGGKAENFKVVLGSNSMIPGFESGLIGAAPNKPLELKVTFPAEYHAKDLAGKDATFAIKVHSVSKSKLPELNDEFAKRHGIQEGIAELRNVIRKNLENELQQRIRHQLRKVVFNKLVELNNLEIPQALVEREAQHLRDETKERLQNKMHVNKIPALPLELFFDEAKRRVHLGLLFNEYVKLKNLTADPEQVKRLVENTAAAYQKPEEVVQWYYQDPSRLAPFESLALEEQVVDLLLQQANVIEKPFTFQEFNEEIEKHG